MISVKDGKRLIQFLENQGYTPTSFRENSLLVRLFNLMEKVPLSQIPYDSRERFKKELNTEMMITDDEFLYSTLRVIPFWDCWFIVDSPSLSSTDGGFGVYYSNKEGMYGFIGGDGIQLCRHVLSSLSPKRKKKGLDLCTGSGLVGITLSSFIDSVLAVDIDRDAYRWCSFNTELNERNNFKVLLGNLYEPVKDEGPFDIITANPSYSFFSPEVMGKYYIRNHEVGGGDYGLELVSKIIDGLEDNLSSNGYAYICTLIPIIRGKDYIRENLLLKFSSRKHLFTIYYIRKKHPSTIECLEYYKKLGIDYFYFVIIEIVNGEEFGIRKRIWPYFKQHYYSQWTYLLRKLGLFDK